ncbi:hypothetical protein SFB93_00140 [Kurthia gibsonii]|uniref:hypothetical protein n=1 Tax=Kurthia TaxID=1649 RepID=UPI000745C457|nr:hypothetical protein [Kurthia sp. 11kri321]AMA62934.1 hypothetical protein ASO14_2418 [Kurthia sp. 11kri321]
MEQIVFETMVNYNEYIERIKLNINPLIESLREEKPEEQLNEVANLIEGLEWLVTVNQKLSELNYENKIDVFSLNQQLQEVVVAIENQDYNLCADILEYDILETIQTYQPYNLEGEIK